MTIFLRTRFYGIYLKIRSVSKWSIFRASSRIILEEKGKGAITEVIAVFD